MKKVILSLAMMFLSVGAMAQTWRVVKKDGSVVRFPAAAVEYVTIAMSDDQSGIIDGHEYVDLGLPSGTLWATCNIGASKPEEYGDYFAWGETKPKDKYDLETYKWCNMVDTLLTKYCTDSLYGTVDNKTELEFADDAAYVNWGPNWCMPDSIQMWELIDSVYTTTEWTTVNDVYGCKITSKTNGNSIFLPYAGQRNCTGLDYAGLIGLYWSRTLSRDYEANVLFVDYNGSGTGSCFFGYGLSVRPVRISNAEVNITEFEDRMIMTVVCPYYTETHTAIFDSNNMCSSYVITIACKNSTIADEFWEEIQKTIAEDEELGYTYSREGDTVTLDMTTGFKGRDRDWILMYFGYYKENIERSYQRTLPQNIRNIKHITAKVRHISRQ